MVEKTDAGGDIVAAAPVEIDLDQNLGFRSVSLDPACTHASRARAAEDDAQGIAPIDRVKARLKRLTLATCDAT
ncbi:hypothetical protein EKJ_00360 [Qipengyuania flava]|uniref:Uncharacterized protein n=1 Tax=Qipengyuania flava TaxID=192812 RepID=A0A3T1CDY9_9SPHN|nr:hypothetical protein EKJ_00360 [Qipengyuania flava]